MKLSKGIKDFIVTELKKLKRPRGAVNPVDDKNVDFKDGYETGFRQALNKVYKTIDSL